MPDELPTPEFGFMRAAEKAIKDLQETAAAQGELLVKARNDARWRKYQVRALAIVCAALIVLSTLTTIQYFHTRDLTTRVQQGAVASCMNSNHIRADNIKIWNHVLDALLVPSPGESTQQKVETNLFVQETEGFIAKAYAPQNCISLFGTSGADPANAG